MINDIYNRKILGFAADIPRLQTLGRAGRNGGRPFPPLRLQGDGGPRR